MYVIYDKPRNEKFVDTLKSIQYNATVAIAGAIKGISEEKLYNELGLEYLRDRRWMQRICVFHNIFNLKSPKCLCDLILPVTLTRNNKNIYFRTEHFMIFFLLVLQMNEQTKNYEYNIT